MPGPAFHLKDASPTGLINMGPGPISSASYTPVQADLYVYNPGTSTLTITAINVTTVIGNTGDFSLTGLALPQTIAAGVTAIVGSVLFTPTVTSDGVVETGTLVFTSDAVSGLQHFNLQAVSSNTASTSVPIGVLAGYRLSLLLGNVMPSLDLGSLSIGDALGFTMYVRNANHTIPCTVLATANASAGFNVTPNSLTIAANSIGSFTVTGVVPSTVGNQDILDAVSINTAGNPNSNATFEVFYSPNALVPAFTLTGDVEATCLADQNSNIKKFDPGTFSDDTVYFARQYYIDQPHLNKILNRLWLLYERTTAGLTCTIQASVINPTYGGSVSSVLALGLGTDGKNQLLPADLVITGTCILLEFTITGAGATSFASFIGWLLKVDEIGEAIEGT